MRTKLIRIGNSRGVRLPKPFIEQTGLTDDVEMNVEDGAVIIQSARVVRSGWERAASELNRHGQDALLDPIVHTRFDEDDWTW